MASRPRAGCARFPSCATRAIVALTGFGQPDDRRRTRAAGFDLHLVKPADLDALTRMLDELDATDA